MYLEKYDLSAERVSDVDLIPFIKELEAFFACDFTRIFRTNNGLITIESLAPEDGFQDEIITIYKDGTITHFTSENSNEEFMNTPRLSHLLFQTQLYNPNKKMPIRNTNKGEHYSCYLITKMGILYAHQFHYPLWYVKDKYDNEIIYRKKDISYWIPAKQIVL